MHPFFVRFRVSESGRNRVQRSGERSSRPHHLLPKNPRNTLRFIRCVNGGVTFHVLKLVLTATGLFRTISLKKIKRLLETIRPIPKND